MDDVPPTLKDENMRYGTKDIDWAEVGAMLAHAGDDEQSSLFIAFCKELRTACGTAYNVDMQMGHVQRKLPKADQELLSALGPDMN